MVYGTTLGARACESDFDEVQRVQYESGQRPPGHSADQVLIPNSRQEVGWGEEGGRTPSATGDGGEIVASVHSDSFPVQIEGRKSNCEASSWNSSHFVGHWLLLHNIIWHDIIHACVCIAILRDCIT